VYKSGDFFGLTCGGVSGEDAAGDLTQYVRSFQLGGSGSSSGAGPIVDGAPFSFASVAWFAVVRKVTIVSAGAGGGASDLRVKQRRIVKTLRPLDSALTAEELHELTLFCFIAALQLYAQVYESAASARSAILDYLPPVLRREDVRAYVARHPASAHPLDISDTASLIRCLHYTFDTYGRPLRLVGAISLYVAGLKARGALHALVCACAPVRPRACVCVRRVPFLSARSHNTHAEPRRSPALSTTHLFRHAPSPPFPSLCSAGRVRRNVFGAAASLRRARSRSKWQRASPRTVTLVRG
jgi:hypothetical protein